MAIKAGFKHNAINGWTGPDPMEFKGHLAKLKSSLRRLSLPDGPDDFDIEEHQLATHALWASARALSSRTRMGWTLPWGLRVKICEVLQQGRSWRAIHDSHFT